MAGCCTMLVKFIVFACVSMAPSISLAQGTRRINLQVDAHSCQGQPLAGYGIKIAYVDAPDDLIGTLDANGRCSFQLDIPGECNVLHARLFPQGEASTREQRDRLRREWNSLLGKNYIRIDKHLDMVEGEDEYTLHFVGEPAIVISVKTTDTDGKPSAVQSVIMARYISTPSFVTSQMSFDIAGIPKGKKNELFFRTGFGRGAYVTALPLAIDLTANDFMLSKVVLPDPPVADTKAIFTLQSLASRHRLGYLVSPGLTLISEDTKLILSYRNDINLRISKYWGGSDILFDIPFEMPSGTYYVAPEAFKATEHQLILLDSIRAGMNLEKYDIPKIVISKGVVNALTIETLNIYAALDKLGVDLKKIDD